MKMIKKNIIPLLLIALALTVTAQKKKEVFQEVNYGGNNKGTPITIQFEKGKAHNHPLFAIWLADENGKYIQTLYVSESIGQGEFKHAVRGNGKWLEGEILRPAALPYWAHQRNIINEFGSYTPTKNHCVVDAYTGATPSSSFILHTKTGTPLSGKYRIMLELNQCWDWNEFWSEDKYLKDVDYRTSGQPALVYAVDIDINNAKPFYIMKPIGHSHYLGADGSLTPDLSTITTALKIAKKITVTIN
ncbi:MAG: hypothetical protein Q8904_11215 [Bacteroidota bacterium]|nr:hypothetical protein [Bacteroidota bacterium]